MSAVPLLPRDSRLSQARNNLLFARELLASRPDDATWLGWAVTAAFYCAVHCIEAHLASFGVRTTSHRSREALMAMPRYGVPADVFASYRMLRWWSEGARYHGRQFDAEMVETAVLNTHLDRILKFVGLQPEAS